MRMHCPARDTSRISQRKCRKGAQWAMGTPGSKARTFDQRVVEPDSSCTRPTRGTPGGRGRTSPLSIHEMAEEHAVSPAAVASERAGARGRFHAAFAAKDRAGTSGAPRGLRSELNRPPGSRRGPAPDPCTCALPCEVRRSSRSRPRSLRPRRQRSPRSQRPRRRVPTSSSTNPRPRPPTRTQPFLPTALPSRPRLCALILLVARRAANW